MPIELNEANIKEDGFQENIKDKATEVYNKLKEVKDLVDLVEDKKDTIKKIYEKLTTSTEQLKDQNFEKEKAENLKKQVQEIQNENFTKFKYEIKSTLEL